MSGRVCSCHGREALGTRSYPYCPVRSVRLWLDDDGRLVPVQNPQVVTR